MHPTFDPKDIKILDIPFTRADFALMANAMTHQKGPKDLVDRISKIARDGDFSKAPSLNRRKSIVIDKCKFTKDEFQMISDLLLKEADSLLPRVVRSHVTRNTEDRYREWYSRLKTLGYKIDRVRHHSKLM